MKIFIRAYQSPFIGNCSTDVLHINNNKITVEKLKEILFEKYKIPPSQQKLTTKIANRTIVSIIFNKVTMTNEWELAFFYIRENSKIYIEVIQTVDKVNQTLILDRRNSKESTFKR